MTFPLFEIRTTLPKAERLPTRFVGSKPETVSVTVVTLLVTFEPFPDLKVFPVVILKGFPTLRVARAAKTRVASSALLLTNMGAVCVCVFVV